MTMGRIVGIDLGTTNSVIAILDQKGPRVLINKENLPLTRSVVAYDRGKFIIGSLAINRYKVVRGEESTVFSIKRLMGRSFTLPDGTLEPNIKEYNERYSPNGPPIAVKAERGTASSLRVVLAGEEFTPEQISAEILRKLKNDAEFRLGGEPITHAVITVPAYFSERQRLATRTAGELAGLVVITLVNEPAAAAVSYGIDTRQDRSTFTLVYDLGGGTFDVSIIAMKAGTYIEMNKDGDLWLGGDDFDRKIVDYVAEKVAACGGRDPRFDSQIIKALALEATLAKETLSAASSYIFFNLGEDRRGTPIEVELTRACFDRLIQPLVDRTIDLTLKAIAEAQLKREDIDYVLPIGNASSVPLVQETLANLFGSERIRRDHHPKECVALGAAIIASQGTVNCEACGHANRFDADRCVSCGQLVVSRRILCPSCGASHEYGKERCEECGYSALKARPDRGTNIAQYPYGLQTQGDEFHIFVEKNDRYETPIEKRITMRFKIPRPDMGRFYLPVYGGECRDRAKANELQGEATVILPKPLHQHTPVVVSIWLKADGIFDLTAELEDGTDLRPIIFRGEENQKIVEDLDKLHADNSPIIKEMSPAEQRAYEVAREQAYRQVRDGEIDDARDAYTEVHTLVEEIVHERERQRNEITPDRVESLVNFSYFVIEEYGWALPESPDRLKRLISRSEQTLDRRDSYQMSMAYSDLDREIERVLGWGSGRKMTLAGFIMNLRFLIDGELHKKDAVEAIRCKRELERITDRLRRGDQTAMDAIYSLYSDVIERVDRLDQKDRIFCPECGTSNSPLSRYCSLCNEDLWLLASDRGLGYRR